MAVIITASQKSLAVALSVIVYLPASIGDHGLITVAAIIAQVVQVRTCGLTSVWRSSESVVVNERVVLAS